MIRKKAELPRPERTSDPAEASRKHFLIANPCNWHMGEKPGLRLFVLPKGFGQLTVRRFPEKNIPEKFILYRSRRIAKSGGSGADM
jgi:hypothetical protein